MRLLKEILEDANNGIMPSHEESYYALVMLSSLQTMAISDIIRVIGVLRDDQPMLKMRLEQIYGRRLRASQVSPKKWLGENNDPKRPEVQKRREVSKKIWDKFSKKYEEENNAGD